MTIEERMNACLTKIDEIKTHGTDEEKEDMRNAFCNEDLYIKDENSIKTITAVQLIYKEKNNKKFTFLLSKHDEFKNIIKLLFTSNFGSDSLNCEPPYYPNELSKIQKCNLYYNYKNINIFVYDYFELTWRQTSIPITSTRAKIMNWTE